MVIKTKYHPGDWKAICAECGRTFLASQMRKRWEGYYVCEKDWEPRQPQDFVQGRVPKITPPWVQPEQAPLYVPMCTPQGRTAYPGIAIPGCVVPSFVSPFLVIE